MENNLDVRMGTMDPNLTAAVGVAIGQTMVILAFYLPLKRMWTTENWGAATFQIWFLLTIAYIFATILIPLAAQILTEDPYISLVFPEATAVVASAMCGWVPGSFAALLVTAIRHIKKLLDQKDR